jgi:murein DD-endopeptidase MepM/ murein hydrolase activator NlpD
MTADPPFSASREVVSPPLTRRELRERELRGRERSAEVAAPTASRRESASPTARAKPRRRDTSTPRRDAVRIAAVNKTLGKRLLSFGAMLFAGTLAFGMTVPANAFNTRPDETALAESLELEAQTVEVDPTLVSFAQRDAWTVTSWAEMLRLRYGNRSFDYTIGTGPIRWPFPYAVPITSGFGARAAPCRGCSTDHSGLDFGTGYGAAIFSVADGVVVERSTGGGTWGNFIVIESTTPDGQVFQAGYAHMASDSSALVLGDQVKVGDFIGLTGATGQVSGAHLHFTIKIDGSFVDPFTFLKRYAG